MSERVRNLEGRVYEDMKKHGFFRPIDTINPEIVLYALGNGSVYRERKERDEEFEKITFLGKDIELVKIGEVNPEEIKEESRAIRKFVPSGQIGECTPYKVNVDTGEVWEDYIMCI
jgi:hypothetical protein